MTMRKGSKGPEVEDLQEKLNRLGYQVGRPDGAFGRRTREAVISFQQRYLVDGIVDPVTETAIDSALDAWEGSGTLDLAPVPHSIAELERDYGRFDYEETGGGQILIDEQWIEENIVRATLPIVGDRMVHRLAEPAFRKWLQLVQDKGLDGEMQVFLTWYPRHQYHKQSNPLSLHSWGIAADVDPFRNPVGRVGEIHPGIVDAAERCGFRWGGRFRRRDDMHFELHR